MALSQSIFLQALGWATLNSFWQMGLLWCVYQLTGHFATPDSNRKYLHAVYSLAAGAAWFAFTFYSFYIDGGSSIDFLDRPLPGAEYLPAILTAASLTYLLLLTVPTVNVYRNWRYVKAIRKTGLGKAPVKVRVFVEKIAAHIGIGRTVRVYLSNLVTSPMTVGYLKPIILVPVAALNNLTPNQLEAVLLHELSHIRRYDYLVNLFVTALNVVLYYNPFVRLFIRALEAERENCCDELVLQFEYDKVAYASALLELEKSNHRSAALAMGATKGNNLLLRIERIVGIQRKSRLNVQHLMGAFAALMLLFTLNSLVITSREPAGARAFQSTSLAPYAFLQLNQTLAPYQPAPAAAQAVAGAAQRPVSPVAFVSVAVAPPPPPPTEVVDETQADNPAFRTVAFDETASQLSPEQRQEVQSAVSSARQLLEVQWQEVEKTIPDGLTGAEREAARRQYLSQVDAINWQRFEKNLQNGYGQGNVDLERINSQLNQQIAMARLDSVQSVYRNALAQLNKVNADAARSSVTPLPDVSLTELSRIRKELEQKIAAIEQLKGRKDAKGSVKL
ncbi:MAG: M56 family metallopeptidase [Chitinophagaceae bacterium]|nr:MAG: M56 family metallopeptidase [Chitinophagaceae bacterium]